MLLSAIRKAINSGPLVVSALSVIALFLVSVHAQANEDVPPAVPVGAVQAESLPLPEPINKKSISTQKQSTHKKDTPTINEGGGPNALERLWGKIVKATKSESEEKPEEGTWTKEETVTEEPKAMATSADRSSEAKIVKDERYLAKHLVPAKPEGGGFYVLELFTTQACPFCPKADAMLEIYSSLSHVIALSCHIDYFDVKEGSLSLPMCSSRQTSYERYLKGQSKYTPQMVVNGRYDAVGYLSEKIELAFKQAHEHPVEPLMVMPKNSAGFASPIYGVELPVQEEARYQLWLVAYDEPLAVNVKGGANAGKDLAYYNTVTKARYLGSWDGQPRKLTIEPRLPKSTRGFSFFVQNADTGAIVLAGKNE